MLFLDRAEAGARLAAAISARGYDRPVVYALPRGGVAVARPVADALAAPLDLVLVRKVPAPGQPELALAAVVDGERPDLAVNEQIRTAFGLTDMEVQRLAAPHLAEIERRRRLYLRDRTPIAPADRDAILVDDGVATGASLKAAIAAVRRRGPRRLIVAVPVAAPDSLAELEPLADEVICLSAPREFRAVGAYYQRFPQLTDADVLALLAPPAD